jgi:hypothetical protein
MIDSSPARTVSGLPTTEQMAHACQFHFRCIELIDGRRQLPRRTASQRDELLLQRGEKPVALLVRIGGE